MSHARCCSGQLNLERGLLQVERQRPQAQQEPDDADGVKALNSDASIPETAKPIFTLGLSAIRLGALLIWTAPREVVEAFVAQDPHVREGLVTGWAIRDWNVVIG